MYRCHHCGKEFRTVAALGGHYSALGIKAPKAPKTKPPKPDNPPADDPSLLVTHKALPIEAILHRIVIPPLHGEHEAELYNAGFQHGLLVVILGVRLAQELSSLGIAQAAPLIQMAREMRQAEAQAARTAAEEAAQKAAHAVAETIAKTAAAAPRDIASAPNPLEGLFARHLEKALSPLLERLLSPFTPQANHHHPGNPIPPTPNTPPTPGTPK
jgi:hypothetical protein